MFLFVFDDFDFKIIDHCYFFVDDIGGRDGRCENVT